jgi:uncharacterized protein YaaQ
MNISSITLLMLAIVQEQDLSPAIQALEETGVFVVCLASTGGFLNAQNATLLVGLHKEQEQDAFQAMKKACRQRIEFIALSVDGPSAYMPMPVSVMVGGATVFVLPVENSDEF